MKYCFCFWRKKFFPGRLEKNSITAVIEDESGNSTNPEHFWKMISYQPKLNFFLVPTLCR